MSKTPFMPLWVSDFVGDTMGLDAQEVGAYLLLIMAQWQAGGASLDKDKAPRMARCGRSWPKVWGNIGHYFQEDEAGIFSPKCRELRESVTAKRDVNSQNGALGGKAKALKKNGSRKANAKETPQRNADIPEPYPEREGDRLDKSNPPPSSAVAEIVTDHFLAHLAKAVGYTETPPSWKTKASRGVIAGWFGSGLKQVEVVRRAKASREVHKEPPATVQALSSFMGPSTRRAAEPPAAEADIIAHWVKTLNGEGYVPQSAIKPNLARQIIATGLVDPERLKSRGVAF